jgi:hypothetical protein
MTTCVVCGERIPGWPDDDRCCVFCEQNFAGDPLRHPPQQQRPVPWWERERLPLAPRRDGLRALRSAQGSGPWADEHGREERDIGH